MKKSSMVFKNRYSEEIKFESQTEEKDGEMEIRMSGYAPDYLRVGFVNETGAIDMVDPSSGPYITIGSAMGLFDPRWSGLRVHSIYVEEGYTTLITHRI
jgi:hypothetical protein